MDHDRFDALTRSLGVHASRRSLGRALAGGGLGALLGSAFGALAVDAKQKRHKKKNKKKKPKKPKPNAFGCLNVGDACKTPDQCCSGICEGKKNKRKCLAHDTGTCNQEAAGVCTGAVPALSACNNRTNCGCFRTTADSNYCAELFGEGLSQCATCQRDADCVAMGLPPGSACAPVSEGFCAGVCPSGMACLIPCGSGPPPP